MHGNRLDSSRNSGIEISLESRSSYSKSLNQPGSELNHCRTKLRCQNTRCIALKLNLGCGSDIRKGYLNVDNVNGPNVDFLMDIEEPFPFSNSSIDEIVASHVLEHTHRYASIIKECHRVLKPGGKLEIRVPYGINSDPFHLRFFWEDSLTCFYSDNPSMKTLEFWSKMFKLEELRVLRTIPCLWHLKHYLGIKLSCQKRWQFPIGKRVEIIWVLVKNAV